MTKAKKVSVHAKAKKTTLQAKAKKSPKKKLITKPHKKTPAKKSKPKLKKLTVKEMVLAVHQQAVTNQQNLRSLEHFSHRTSGYFRTQHGADKLQTFRTVHSSRGK